eukprot:scaffold119_cov245-Chaetoceros_neogracile.AAC.2
MANFEEYKAFREIHGRAPYIHENLVLFHWCSEVRIGYKKREQGLEVIASNGVEITVGREALLRSVGFDFILPVSTNRKPTDASADRSFADRIKSLKRYKEKHGHLNHRLNGDDDRYDALNAIGYPFGIVYPISPIEPEGSQATKLKSNQVFPARLNAD